MKKIAFLLAAFFILSGSSGKICAHPASGIIVDRQGKVYFIYSWKGVVKISPDGNLSTVLKSERPWTPTGVALYDGNIYVLEYTNANGPFTEGWVPRVRKVDSKGNISVLADFSSKQLPDNSGYRGL